MPTCSGALTRKQQWRRVGRRKAVVSSPRFVPEQRDSVGTCAGPTSLEGQSMPKWDPVFWWGCSRPLAGTECSGSWTRHKPMRSKHGVGSACKLIMANRKSPPKGGRTSPASPSENIKVATTKEALTETRKVHFDNCVRVRLVPSRRDLDAATAHGVWWGPADVSNFRWAAYRYFEKHGKLSGVSEEELEEVGPPPGMPTLPIQTAGKVDIATATVAPVDLVDGGAVAPVVLAGGVDGGIMAPLNSVAQRQQKGA